MNNIWLQVMVPIAVALIAAAGKDIFFSLFRRRKERLDETQILSGIAVDLVEPLRTELARVRREARAIARELQDLRVAVMSPEATLELIRDMVKRPSAMDGEDSR